MSDKRSAWLAHYARFQGAVQQLVAGDIHEHGTPHQEREHSVRDIQQFAVEMGGLAFELYIAAVSVEERIGIALAKTKESVALMKERLEDHPDFTADMIADIEWADKDPNERN